MNQNLWVKISIVIVMGLMILISIFLYFFLFGFDPQSELNQTLPLPKLDQEKLQQLKAK
jgi:hypothetical protein